jgi:hypothetical protein
MLLVAIIVDPTAQVYSFEAPAARYQSMIAADFRGISNAPIQNVAAFF